jgi:hypothetical protein
LTGDEVVSAAAEERELWDADESLAENGILVVASTGPGTFALTGAVIDASTGAPVPGASVTIQRSAGGQSTQATTDADGAFAFVDVAVPGGSADFDLTVSALGYGLFRVINDPYLADETYVGSVELETEPQTYDESGPQQDNTIGAAAAGSGGYPSDTRVPEDIKVALFEIQAGTNCISDEDKDVQARNYPWKFYVLHVLTAEIYADWGLKAVKANAGPVQNYAWAEKKDGQEPYGPNNKSADISNVSNRHQCFKPHKKVPRKWKTWVEDVIDERIANKNGVIQKTEYRQGDYRCQEDLYPRGGDKLSQWGSKARADSDTQACGGDEAWRDIDEYYYTWSVKAGQEPAAPSTSHETASGKITFTFESTGGWRYILERYPRPCPGPDPSAQCWEEIYNRGWSWKKRKVPTSFTWDQPGCYRYRVKAKNPVGASSYKDYARGREICI